MLDERDDEKKQFNNDYMGLKWKRMKQVYDR